MRFWYLAHFQAQKAQVSLSATVQTRKSLRCLHTQSMGVDEVRSKFRPLASLDMSAWAYSGGL